MDAVRHHNCRGEGRQGPFSRLGESLQERKERSELRHRRRHGLPGHARGGRPRATTKLVSRRVPARRLAPVSVGGARDSAGRSRCLRLLPRSAKTRGLSAALAMSWRGCQPRLPVESTAATERPRSGSARTRNASQRTDTMMAPARPIRHRASVSGTSSARFDHPRPTTGAERLEDSRYHENGTGTHLSRPAASARLSLLPPPFIGPTLPSVRVPPPITYTRWVRSRPAPPLSSLRARFSRRVGTTRGSREGMTQRNARHAWRRGQ